MSIRPDTLINSYAALTFFAPLYPILCLVNENGWIGALACRDDKAIQSSCGNISGRVLDHWPHLIKAAPDDPFFACSRKHVLSMFMRSK